MRVRRSMEDGAAVKGGVIAFLGIALVLALVAATNQAFAVKRAEAVNESTFHLGHVAVKCMDARAFAEANGSEGDDDASQEDEEDSSGELIDPSWPLEGDELAVGVVQERSYVIVNEGEEAYVRIASHTVLDDLVHINDTSVIEPSAAEDEDDGVAPEAASWVFGADGFWYRTVPLKVGERIVVSVSVQIPFSQAWVTALSTGAPSEVIETVQVEAMQARNAAFDADSVYPWGELERDPESDLESGPDEDGNDEDGSDDDGSNEAEGGL